MRMRPPQVDIRYPQFAHELIGRNARGQAYRMDLLATLKQEIGELAKVKRIVRVGGFVNSVENFTQQWLGLREIDFTEPSFILYPEYDHLLKTSNATDESLPRLQRVLRF